MGIVNIHCTRTVMGWFGMTEFTNGSEFSPESRDWYAEPLLSQDRRLLLFTHVASLYSFIVVPRCGSGRDYLETLFLEGYMRNALGDGVGVRRMVRLVTPPAHVRVCKATDRRTIGVMNRMKRYCLFSLDEADIDDEKAIRSVNSRLNRVLFEMKGYSKPLDEIRKF